jgi:predicted alpha/beta hydrolase family esterase
MSSIYFGGGSPITKVLVNIVTKSLRVIMPKMAMKISRKVLTKPVQRKNTWPNKVIQSECTTKHGKVKIYQYGEGKPIWLVHGWSGAGFQFWPLMQKLADKGFSTFTFDLPAHGYSEGEFSSLPKMIQAFDDISEAIQAPSMVIAHSMGASVIANSAWMKSYKSDIMLISPLLKTFDLLQETVNKTGFDQVLFERIIQEVYEQDKMHVPKLNACQHFSKFSGNIKMIHDEDDKFAPIKDSKNLARDSDVELLITSNLGHSKILRSNKIFSLI